MAAAAHSGANKKLRKANDQKATEIEEQVARAFSEVELEPEFKDLYITAVKEVDAPNNKKALVVFVPFRHHKKFQKIQPRLIRELEKKFNGRHVVFIAQRTILSKQWKRQNSGAIRPRSRTLTAVHEKILDDLVYPTQIVGKRTRVSLNGKLLKVYLDPKDVKEVEYKLKTFSAVYKKLTNKSVDFVFPLAEDSM